MNKKEIATWLKKHKIYDYEIVNDPDAGLLVIVNDDVFLCDMDIEKLPFKFIEVFGSFAISWNELESLENCPTYVHGDFDCSRNLLDTLEGCPKWVKGRFIACENRYTLQSITPLLESEVEGDVYLDEHLGETEEFSQLMKIRRKQHEKRQQAKS